MPRPPAPGAESDAFRSFLEKYVVLIRELQQLGVKLGRYIRGREREQE